MDMFIGRIRLYQKTYAMRPIYVTKVACIIVSWFLCNIPIIEALCTADVGSTVQFDGTCSRAVGTQCSFTCIDKYTPYPGAKLQSTCLASNEWSPLPTPCYRKFCTYPSGHENGILTVTDVNQGTSVTRAELTCPAADNLQIQPGQELVFLCNANVQVTMGTWDIIVTPCASSICESPIGRACHVSTSVCDGATDDSVCKYRCDDGYEYAQGGVKSTTCQKSTYTEDGVLYGQGWSDVPGVCQRRKCLPYATMKHGTMDYCHDDAHLNSQCTYSCDEGYEPETGASMETTCQFENDVMMWTPLKACIKRSCQLKPIGVHGTIGQCGDGDKLGSICVLTCDQDYIIHVGGDSRTTCLKDSKWNPWLLFCTPRLCATPSQQNGHIESCSKATSQARYHQCDFSCNKGYRLPTGGVQRTVCEMDNDGDMVWINELTPCELQVCPKHHQVNGHERSCTASKRYFGHECIFACDPGYTLPAGGTRQAKCVAAGDSAIDSVKWSAELTPCQPASCTTKPVLHFQREMSCSDGDKTGSVCMYTCQTGARTLPTGYVDQTTCTADDRNGAMTWQPALSGCLTKQSCNEVYQVNGHLEFCSKLPAYQGTTCTYTCNHGYHLPQNGANIITCVFTAENQPLKWDKELADCEYDSCEEPKQAFGARRTCTHDYKLGSVCHFQCIEGFTLPEGGMDHTQCLARDDGALVWDRQLTACIRHSCQMSTQEHGLENTCTEADRLYESSCMFRCENGYELPNKGIHKSTCVANGMTSNDAVIWDEPTLTNCTRRVCPEMAQFNGHLIGECTRQFGTSCWYACDVGHKLRDNRTQIVVSCVSTANGPAVQWDKELPACRRKECTKMAPPNMDEVFCSDGYRFESVCRFRCHTGWAVSENGVTAIKCMAMNSTHGDIVDWVDPPLSACERRLCPAFEAVSNANLSKDCNRRFETECSIVCDDGYDPSGGQASAQCVYDEDSRSMQWRWDKGLHCRKRSCPKTSQAHGYEVSCTDAYQFESNCTFRCEDPFYLPANGTESVVCSFRRDFAGIGVMYFPEPTPCARRSCRAPTQGNATLMSCSNEYLFESTCDFQCMPGYGIADNSTKCLLVPTNEDNVSMLWNPPLESCQVLSCPVPTRGNGHQLNCSNPHTYQSICALDCDIGFYSPSMKNDVIECIATPQGVAWNETLPDCIERSCDEPNATSNTSLEQCSNHFKYGSHCVIKCDDGFHLKTSGLFQNTIMCTASREPGSLDDVMAWNAPETECVLRSCEDIRAAKNGYFSNCTNHLRFGSVCQFRCHIGSHWSDDDMANNTVAVRTTKCSALTTLVAGVAFMVWEPEISVCRRYECPPISQENGHLVRCTRGFEYGTVCHFECNPGYIGQRSHYNIARCRTILDAVTELPTEYSWNVTLSDCIAHECPESDIRNGSLDRCSDGLSLGSTCAVACADGFETTSGRDEVATCERKIDEDGQSFLGWTSGDGAMCVVTDECRSNPCMNSAQCVDHDGYYTCECGFWQSGTNCERDHRNLNADSDTQTKCEGNEECSFEPTANQNLLVDNVLVGLGVSTAALTVASLAILQSKFAFIQKILTYAVESLAS